MSRKHLVIAVLVLLVGYWMLTDPTGLADVSKSGAERGLVVGAT